MATVISYKEAAMKELQMANYLISTAYRLTNETKNLLLVSNHVLSSLMNSVSAILFFERSKRAIPPYHNTQESKLRAFKEHLVKRYGLQTYYETIQKIINLSKGHENASVEFTRDNKYIMCAPQFKKIDTVSENDMKNYIKDAKEFVSHVERIIANE